MCFSAETSFGAAAILAVTGIATLKKVVKPKQILFALIPMLFAVQQAAEGFLWLSKTGAISPGWEKPSALLFLFYAQIAWPVWVPLAMLRVEEERPRRMVLWTLLVSGILFSVYTAYWLFSYPVTIDVSGHHIDYRLAFPSIAGPFDTAAYVLATVFAPFVSSVPRMRAVGFGSLIAFLSAATFYDDYIISVWCFFAAIISITVLFVLSSRVDTGKLAVELPGDDD